MAVALIIALNMTGPAALLLLLRRWTGRWWVAVPAAVAAAPFVSFYLSGGVACLMTYLRLVVRGDAGPAGKTLEVYLGMTFGAGGVLGVLLACVGLGLSLPMLGLWRLVHRRSFDRLSRRPA